ARPVIGAPGGSSGRASPPTARVCRVRARPSRNRRAGRGRGTNGSGPSRRTTGKPTRPPWRPGRGSARASAAPGRRRTSKRSDVRRAWQAPRLIDAIEPDPFELVREAVPVVAEQYLFAAAFGLRRESRVVAYRVDQARREVGDTLDHREIAPRFQMQPLGAD